MKRLYSEEQYKTYSKFMKKIKSEELADVNVYIELSRWIGRGTIPVEAIKQMDKRIDNENNDV